MREGSEHEKRREILQEVGKGFGVLLLLVLMMFWLSGVFVSKVESGPPSAKAQSPNFNTLKVERREFPLLMDQVGTLRTQTEAQVSSRIMAQVNAILVREGDRVIGSEEKDATPTILARLDDRDIQARLRQAQSQRVATDRALEAARAKLGSARAQLDSARANRDKALSDYRRYDELRKSKAISGQQLDHARAQRDMSEAQMQAHLQDVQAAQGEVARAQAQKDQAEAAEAEARVMLSYTQIQAPFTGKVIKKMVDIGDMASPGQPLFFIETPSHPQLHAFLSESLIPSLKPGQKLDVHVDALNRDFKGTLSEMIPQSDPATRTFLAKVSLPPDPELVNGLFGRLRAPYGKYEAVVVPVGAVREVGQLYLVNVLAPDGHPQRRFVTLGRRHGDLVEVLSGLQESEEVVFP